MPEFLLIPEVAAMARLPESTLRYWRLHGGGPASFRLGRRVVYRAEDVAAWMRERENATASSSPGGRDDGADEHDDVELERLDGPALTPWPWPGPHTGPGTASAVERARYGGEVDAR